MKNLCLALLLTSLCTLPARAQLVIAGGGLKSDTETVWQAFIAGAEDDGNFVIVPSASGSPAASANSVRTTLQRYGVAAERISVAPLAIRDDRSTPDIDERKWKKNANSDEVADQLSKAAAIWFTGGDQSRTTDLFNKDGKGSAVLQAVRHAQERGAAIGGTSAGAAIMSHVMIQRGESLPTLTGAKSGEQLKLGEGLGFLASGIVDQHFGERARLGRLATALVQQTNLSNRIGFGIDEDTALLVSEDGDIEVLGNGYVTIIDARQATAKRVNRNVKISGLMLHMASAGDKINYETLSITPADWKSPTVGDEYVSLATAGVGGMAVPGQLLQDVIGEGLIDNAEAKTIERVSFDTEGRGTAFIFTQTKQSEGFWGRGPDEAGRYAIANVQFDITPVAVNVTSLENEK